MKEKIILREIRNVLGVGYEDIPKTLARFKREVEEMEKDLNSSN